MTPADELRIESGGPAPVWTSDLHSPPNGQATKTAPPAFRMPRAPGRLKEPERAARASITGAADAVASDVGRRSETREWIVDAPGEWWVLHTRARNEKKVASALVEKGVRHYLPLIAVRHTYAKAKVTFTVPLFPGYVFLCGDHGDCDVARRTNRLVSILPVTDQGRLRAELSHIYRVVEKGDAVELFPSIQPGQRCRVTGGSLRGLEGVVLHHGRRCRMFLAITMLGQSAVVEVDAALLEIVA